MRGEVKHVVTGGLTGGQTGDVTGGPRICNSFIYSPFRQLTGGVDAILNKHHEILKGKFFLVEFGNSKLLRIFVAKFRK